MEEYLDGNYVYNSNSNNNAYNITRLNGHNYISNNELQNLYSNNNNYNNYTNEIFSGTNYDNQQNWTEHEINDPNNNNSYYNNNEPF